LPSKEFAFEKVSLICLILRRLKDYFKRGKAGKIGDSMALLIYQKGQEDALCTFPLKDV